MFPLWASRSHTHTHTLVITEFRWSRAFEFKNSKLCIEFRFFSSTPSGLVVLKSDVGNIFRMFYRNPNYNNINGSFYPSNNSFIQPAPAPILVNPPITNAVVAPSPPNIITQNPPPLFPTELPSAGFGASRTYFQNVYNYILGTTKVIPIPPPPGAREFCLCNGFGNESPKLKTVVWFQLSHGWTGLRLS